MATKGPSVGIVMGSKSDLEVMKTASTVLAQFGISSEMRVISAHRTPDIAAEYARSAAGRGMKAIIAGAGAAAHLAGAMAANTTLPVIGVPLAGGALNGVDALYATVQMPTGVPVATVAINGSANAAILAAQIMAVSDRKLAARLAEYKEGIRAKAIEADEEVAKADK
ncbi:MAG TPA: 5-(carboxyamino)imidazole ribonucleotide mutase [Bacillota bacterium]|nr:5-(carboxyamino)imidazole ribonucleotide mutase [Bacillota bacterium]HOG53554.1 5-(carboxyamino)imidazole ribonucleotide mutase [Bacillota bacterium]